MSSQKTEKENWKVKFYQQIKKITNKFPFKRLLKEVKSIFWDKWKNNYHYRYLELQSRRSLPQEYTQVQEFVDQDLKTLLDHIKVSKEDKVLDVGSRDGYLVESLSKYCDCTGIELVATTAKYARKIGRNVLCQDMHHLKFPSCYFQGIISRHSLEHSIDFKKVLSEFRRVLIPGGFLFIVIPIEKGTAHDLHTQRFDNEYKLFDSLDEFGFDIIFKNNICPRDNPSIDYENITISRLRK